MNITSSLSTISPEFNVSVRDDNGNDKIGIYYEKGSTVEIFYRGARLCNRALPAFYQPLKNVTLFQTVLKGNGVELAGSDQRACIGECGGETER
uniref:NDR1/HIN1-like protein 13 n=1 Tax=Cicer arietinum TaxID=3827 RepID=A0A3Q7XBJ8_CICAR|nr:NDR1/HIN1-like protein 13 [Cicer arietinum]